MGFDKQRDKVLVTGATGFLGGQAVRLWSQAGWDVVAHGRDEEKLSTLSEEGVTVFSKPLVKITPEDLRHLGITHIVHAAARSNPCGRRSLFERDNIDTTRALVAAAEGALVKRFVFVSSPAVLHRPRDADALGENDVADVFVNAYAWSKREGEKAVLASSVPHIVLRPRGIYGRGDQALLPRVARALRAGPLPLFREGRGATDITHVRDVVEALRLSVEAPADIVSEVFNVAGSEAISIKEMVEVVGRHVGHPVRWRALPFWPVWWMSHLVVKVWEVLDLPGEPRLTPYAVSLFAHRQTLDTTRVREVLGWVPQVSFERGVADVFGQEM